MSTGSRTPRWHAFATDWPRAYATDDHMPTTGETWFDVPGCQVSGICGDGYHAFRYVRIRVEGAQAALESVRGTLLSPLDDALQRYARARAWEQGYGGGTSAASRSCT